MSPSFASSQSNVPHLPHSQAEKQRLEEALNTAQEEEGSLAAAKRALEARLEEAQRGLARLGQEQQALNRALEEEGKQREALRRSKAELEEQKHLLDRTVDRLNKEVGRRVAWAQEEAQLIQKLAWGGGTGEGAGSQRVVFAFLKFIVGEAKSASAGWHPSYFPSVFLTSPYTPFPYDLDPWRMSPGVPLRSL